MNSNLGKQKLFIIYQITNLINGKIYIGAHVTFDINDKYMGSSKYLKKDIKEIGRQNFKKEILHIFDNKKNMMNKEAEIVNHKFCHREDTYNKHIGGINEYTTENMVTVINPEGGYMNVYKDDPRWLSGALKGSTTGSEILKNKLKHDKKLAEEFKQRGIYAMSVAYAKGSVRHDTFKDKKHKQKSKDAIGEANSLKQLGKNNSQYGTCWITKDKENKKIKKEDLDVYLQQGWNKGRE